MSVAAVRRVVSRLAPDRPPTDAELVAAIAPSGSDREVAFGVLVDESINGALKAADRQCRLVAAQVQFSLE